MKLVRTRQRTAMWLIDVLLTLVAWAGLIWLLARGIGSMLDTHGGPRFDAPIFAAINTLQVYLWIAVFNAVILISWARYQQRRGRQFAQRRAEAKRGRTIVLTTQILSEAEELCDEILIINHGREVARGKTGILFFDYAARRPAPVPQGFLARTAATPA